MRLQPARPIRISSRYGIAIDGNECRVYFDPRARIGGLIGSTQLNSRGSIAVFVNSNENNPTHWTGPLPEPRLPGRHRQLHQRRGQCRRQRARSRLGSYSLCPDLHVLKNDHREHQRCRGRIQFHNGNTNSSVATWTGVYTELIEISDNLFTGNSGGILSDIAPQNGGLDEQLGNFVIERNLYSASTTAQGGELLLLSGANMTLRDNVFYMPAPSSMVYPILGVQVAQRGSGNLLTVQYNEAYNNTCYAPNAHPQPDVHRLRYHRSKERPDHQQLRQEQPLLRSLQNTGPTVDNTGSSNAVSNNTSTVTNNPGFTNRSGPFPF